MGGLIIIPTFLAQHATAIIVIEKAKYNIFRNVNESLVQWKPPAHILKNIYGYFAMPEHAGVSLVQIEKEFKKSEK